MAITLEIPPELKAVPGELAEIKKLLVELTKRDAAAPEGGWLKATSFCLKYQISRPTLDRKVKTGEIEKDLSLGVKNPRFRLRRVP